MHPRATRNRCLLCAVCCCLVAFALLSCVSTKPAEVRQESGFYYGVGSGASIAEAADAARRDLISNALTESVRREGNCSLAKSWRSLPRMPNRSD